MNAAALAVATVELRVRLDRLERENARPVPPPRETPSGVFERYEILCRRMRVERGQS